MGERGIWEKINGVGEVKGFKVRRKEGLIQNFEEQ